MMRRLVAEIVKHLKLYLTFIKYSIMSQLEYRTNFATGILMEIGFTFMKILYVIVIYQTGRSFAGFRPDEILLFSGTFIIATSFYVGLYVMNFLDIREHVRQGTLDILITKPVSLQFLLTLRRMDPGMFLMDFTAGIVIVVIAWQRLSIPVTFFTVGGYVFFLILGGIAGYSLFLIPQLLTFWFVNASTLFDVADAFWDFNIMPMVSYNRIVQLAGLIIIPIFMVTNMPPLHVLGKMSPLYLALAITIPFMFFFIARGVFRLALRRYTSTGN
jgi:ABC-2 type transport system permease protein